MKIKQWYPDWSKPPFPFHWRTFDRGIEYFLAHDHHPTDTKYIIVEYTDE